MINWKSVFSNPGPVELYVMHTGYIHMAGNIHFNKKDSRTKTKAKDVRFNPVFSFLIKHPQEGLMLVDTGLHESHAQKRGGNFGLLLGTMVKTKAEPNRDAASQIKSLGISPDQIRHIVLTHLHLDHPSGLPAFKNNGSPFVYADERELKIARSAFGLFQGYIKAHLEGIKIKALEYPSSAQPFDKVWDFFGDGSVFIISTPGHSPGHASVLVNTQAGPVFLTGDAAHRRANLDEGIPPIGDYKAAAAAIKTINQFLTEHPQVKVICSHDPDQLNKLTLAPAAFA